MSINTFSSIKDIIRALKKEEALLSEMFSKRKKMTYEYSHALEIADDDNIQSLLSFSVLRRNDNLLEIDDVFLQFFEQVLEVNEQINLSYINDNIREIKENIEYYFNESQKTNRQYRYLKNIKGILRKIDKITLRSIVDLKRNIDTTFKNEPNYKNKKKKLENLDVKRTDIFGLIKQTRRLVDEEEIIFFNAARDEELNEILNDLKITLNECNHNLIEIEKQIINYLNQIQYQSELGEKLRKIKYLKDRFTLDSDSDIKTVLTKYNDVIFDKKHNYRVKLSLDKLREDDSYFDSLKKVAQKVQLKSNIKTKTAPIIDVNKLNAKTKEIFVYDLEAIKNHFIATSNNLFDFIMAYKFKQATSFNQRVNLYCQIISRFDDSLTITSEFRTKENIHFAVVYANTKL